MNDPGLDEPISNDAKDVEKQHEDEHEEQEEDEQNFLEPRYDSTIQTLCLMLSHCVPEACKTPGLFESP